MSDPTPPPIARDAYNNLADAYAAKVDTKPHNAFYDRPAVLSLLPAVAGLRVLDAGCGPGSYSLWLVNHGAQVVGLDVSEKMIEHARRRVGGRATFHLADLGKPLDFLADESFDLAICPLALDYVRDWRVTLGELRRVLRSGGGGVLVISLEHPCCKWRRRTMTDYFQTERVEETWRGFGPAVVVPMYRRPMQEVINSLLDSGFRLDRFLEPQPVEAFRIADPEEYAELMKEPGFLCLRAIRV
jgi:ubiquinone/menaquinone biosynthesis C-methylase UbiE